MRKKKVKNSGTLPKVRIEARAMIGTQEGEA
jgi:hypothetical protein